MKVGIIGAMEVEVEQLRNDMLEKKETRRAGIDFCEGILCGIPAVIARCGVGKVNAAVCAQVLVDCFGVDRLINTGIAGSLDARINIGDIVISTELVHHDVDAVVFGYDPGQIPSMPSAWFQADKELAVLAEKACRKVSPETGVFHGRIASGDQFISDRAAKEKIAAQFGALCTEMEGASIAQAAFRNEIPFVVIRVISDKADDSSSMEYPVFEEIAAKKSMQMTEEFLRELGKK